ncbi:MAG: pseudouridine-5'-phosphate glycosidase [Rubrobacteraceae bacterium]
MKTLSMRDEVSEALRAGDAVVALESTLISHDLPHPDNIELAREIEDLIRAEGATPATIAVIDGAPKIGLSQEELTFLATAEDIPKLSARDLAFAVAKTSPGATTVAATAHLAARAGIKLFATGGLGGVHRGARESWDVSADLAALARTPVAVVCSGVKSILDIPATLEYLETLNVPVAGFGTRSFPGFYLTDSGCPLDWSIADADEAARIVSALEEIGPESSGLVIANPIPEAEQLDPTLHDRTLKAALEELDNQKIRGKDVTPFLLDYFHTQTGGESLRINKSIIRRNAILAAQIAVAHTALERA